MARIRKMFRPLLLAAPIFVILVLGLRPHLIAQNPAPPEADGLSVVVTERGAISLSADGVGSNEPAGGTLQVEKPNALATVRSAYLTCASNAFLVPTHIINDGDVTLDTHLIAWDQSVVNNTAGGFASFHNVFADVTSIVASKVDTASPGLIDFVETEVDTEAIDGCALYVIFDDPTQNTDNTVSILFGGQRTNGDVFNVMLQSPLGPSDRAEMGLAISWGAQSQMFGTPPHVCGIDFPQSSLINVNGARLTSCAGSSDDGVGVGFVGDGVLITVGGIGDDPANPSDPFQQAADGVPFPGCSPNCQQPRTEDDELYDLKQFVGPTDTNITIQTQNPSDDDNIFAGHIFVTAPAIVQEDATPPVCTRVPGAAGFGGMATDEQIGDSGIFSVELDAGSVNLSLSVDLFSESDPFVHFSVEPSRPGDASGSVIATDGGGNTCSLTFDIRELDLPNGADNTNLCDIFDQGFDNLLNVTNPNPASGLSACSSNDYNAAMEPALPPDIQPAGPVLTVESPVTGDTEMELVKGGDFDPRLRLLFSRSDDGGQTFTAFTNITESVEPGSTRLRGKGRWSVIKVMPGLQSQASAALDIEPLLCPNPLDVRSEGLLPVALLGTENFNIDWVDVPTLRLEGVRPSRAAIYDAGTPFTEPKDDCADCAIEGPDGRPDLVLKFDREKIARALGSVMNTECRLLTLTGNLKPEFGGIPIDGSDVVTIVKKDRRRDHDSDDDDSRDDDSRDHRSDDHSSRDHRSKDDDSRGHHKGKDRRR